MVFVSGMPTPTPTKVPSVFCLFTFCQKCIASFKAAKRQIIVLGLRFRACGDQSSKMAYVYKTCRI